MSDLKALNGSGAAGNDASIEARHTAFTRFYRYLEGFAEGAAPAALGFYPGLRSRPFHDPAGFPIVAALEKAYPAIRSEIAGLDNDAFHRETENVKRTGSWEVVMLFERGRKHHANCERSPVAASIIENHHTVLTMAGLTYVSKMKPGTHIAAHCGPTNLRLRCHLGIEIPRGDCGLRVGNESRQWQEGRCLVFDDHYEHEAWNHTGESRIVLIIDLWHSDLSPQEVLCLRGLHQYTAAQAENLTRYWLANAKERGRKTYD